MTEPTEGTDTGFSFQDKRRIDPVTYQVREQDAAPAPAGGAGSAEGAAEDEVPGEATELEQRIAELTTDLQRLQAEYVNYRKRVERDRNLVREQAVANALAELLPVLDDVERARAHGDLAGAFKSVGESLEAVVARLGMTRFGEPGEAFDPAVHEAIALEASGEVDAPTTTAVHQAGYRFAGRVVRPAVVSVSEPG